MPKVSVIVPFYNVEGYIEKCLETLVNQTLEDIEIIVVNDGSKDNSILIVKRFLEKYPEKIVYLEKENGGLSDSRNYALPYAKGEYVAFLDVDDWMDMDCYYEMTSALDSSGSDIGICSIYTERGSYRLSEIRYNYQQSNTITGDFALRLMCKIEAQNNYISPRVGNKIFRRSLLKEKNIRFPSYTMWEDDMFTFLAFHNAKKVDLIPNVAEHYFQRESSAMHSFSRKHIDCFIAVFSELKCLLSTDKKKMDCEVEYFALLDRCLNTMFDSLFSNEQRVTYQRKYICYLIEELLRIFTIQELLEHIEPQRLGRMWL